MWTTITKSTLAPILLLFFTSNAHAQNLVPNGDFEAYSLCPPVVPFATTTAQWFNPCTSNSGGTVSDVTTPDYFNACAPIANGFSTPSNHAGTVIPHSGLGYMGICTADLNSFPNYREYIEVALTSPLISGQEYVVEMWVACAPGEWDQFGYMSRLGILFSGSALVNQNYPISQQPQLSTSNMINNLNSWQLLSWNYMATGNETYMTIGNWGMQMAIATGATPAQGTGNAYYYIDDVSVVPVSNGTVPSLNLITKPSCYGICSGSAVATITGGMQPYTIEWLDGGLVIGNGAQIDNLCPGNYTISILDAVGNSLIESIVIEENPEIIVSSTTSAATNCTSPDGVLEIVATGGNAPYQFVTNPGNQPGSNITGLNSGNYSTTVTDASSCIAIIESVIEDDTEKIMGDIIASAYAGCPDLCIQFEFSNEENATLFEWEMGDGNTSNDASPEYCYQKSGKYHVELTVTGSNGCQNTIVFPQPIEVYPEPIVEFGWISEHLSNEQAEIKFNNLSEENLSFAWEFSDGSFSTHANPVKTITIDDQSPNHCQLLTGTNEFGCSATAEHCIRLEREVLIFIPNAFTPDGDEFNNVFIPVLNFDQQPEVYIFRIFNRWGELIFESQDATLGWDGTNGSGHISQDGTYSWSFRLRKNSDDTLRELHGSVRLLR